MVKIVTIHGTNNGDPSSSGDYWWQRGSAFQKKLLAYVTHVKGVEFIPFHWSGENSEKARREAGEALFKKLRTMEKDSDDDVALVGHSHGGSVLNHTLFAAAAKGVAFDKVKSWITVGTPFIHTARSANPFNRTGIWGTVTTIAVLTFLFLFAVVVPLQFAVVQDLWNALTNQDVTQWRFRQLRHYSLGGLNLLFFSVIMPVLIGGAIYRLGSRTRKRLSKKHQARFADRWLARWTALNHEDDEAITALKSARTVSLTLVPFDAVRKTVSAVLILLVTLLFAYVSLLFGGRDFIQRHGPLWMTSAEISFKAPGRLIDVAYSPDGKWLATVSGDRAARIIDVESGEIKHLLPHKGGPSALAVSKEGDQLLVFGSSSGVIWNVETGDKVRSIDLENAWASNLAAIAFSNARNVILAQKLTAVLNPDGAAVYDATTGAELFELQSTNKLGLSDPVFSASGDVIYALDVTKKGEIQIFSGKNGAHLGSVFPSFLVDGLPERVEALLGLSGESYDPKTLYDTSVSLHPIVGSDSILFYYTLAYNDKRIAVREAFRGTTSQNNETSPPIVDFYFWVYQDVTEGGLASEAYASASGTTILRFFDGFVAWSIGTDDITVFPSKGSDHFWNPIALSPTAREWAMGRPLSETDPMKIVEIGAFPSTAPKGEEDAEKENSITGDNAGEDAKGGADNQQRQPPPTRIISGPPSPDTTRIDYLDKLYHYSGGIVLAPWTGRVQGDATNQAPDAIEFKPLSMPEWPVFGIYWSLTMLYDRLDEFFGIDETRIASLRSLTDDSLGTDYVVNEARWNGLAGLVHLASFGLFFVFAAGAWAIGQAISFVFMRPLVAVINRGLSEQMRNLAYGHDAYGERVKQVAEGVAPAGESQWSVLPDRIADQITQYTEGYALETLRRLRRFLGDGGKQLGSLDADALSEQVSWQELIHTSYFDIDDFAKLMAVALIERGVCEPTDEFKNGPDYQQLRDELAAMRFGGADQPAKPTLRASLSAGALRLFEFSKNSRPERASQT